MPWHGRLHIERVQAGATSPSPSGLAGGRRCTPWRAWSRDRRGGGTLAHARLSGIGGRSTGKEDFGCRISDVERCAPAPEHPAGPETTYPKSEIRNPKSSSCLSSVLPPQAEAENL